MHPQEKRIYTAILVGMVVLVFLIIFFVKNIIRYQKRKVAFHQEGVRGGFNNLDKEKERIAIELHDDMGGTLSSVKMMLQTMKGLNTPNTQIVEAAEFRIDEVMSKLRKYAFNLMPGVLQRKGLNEALQDLIDLIEDATNIKIEYQFTVPVANKETSIHIYMMVQEMLNNIVKHAKARLIKISVIKKIMGIELHVSDNGVGFNEADITANTMGLGIHNIVSRAGLLY